MKRLLGRTGVDPKEYGPVLFTYNFRSVITPLGYSLIGKMKIITCLIRNNNLYFSSYLGKNISVTHATNNNYTEHK